MDLSRVATFVTNHAGRIMAECKGSAIQTAMVAATTSLGLSVVGMGCLVRHKPLSIAGTVMILSTAHPYTRIVGAAFATLVTVFGAAMKTNQGALFIQSWEHYFMGKYDPLEDNTLHKGAKQFQDTAALPLALIAPVPAVLALAYRAYKLRA